MVNKVPEGWQELTLEQLTKNMVDGPFGSDLKKVHYTENREARIIQLSNIGEEGWKDDNVKYTTFSHADKLKRCIVTYPNVVVAKMMPAGRAMLCPDKESMYVLSSDAVKIVVDDDIIMPEYFVYATKTSYFQDQIDNDTQGSTRQRTSIKKLRQNRLLVPQLVEQEKIVKTLSDIDKLITNLELQVEKDRNLKQACLTHLFPRMGQTEPDLRLSGCLGEWKEWNIGDLAHRFYNGGTPRTSVNKYWNGSIPWIQSQDIIENQLYGVKPRKYISNIAVAESNAKIIPAESIAVVTRVGVGKLAYMPFEYSTSQDFVSLSELLIDAKCLTYALYVMLQNEKKMTQGTSIKGITVKDFLSKKIFLPKEENEQIAIGNILYDIDKNIELNSEKLKKYRALRQGMMEQLLTGKIRL